MKISRLWLLLFTLLSLIGTQSAIASSGCTSGERDEAKAKAVFVGLKMKEKGYKLKASHFDCASTRKKETYTIKNVQAGKKHIFVVVGSKYATDIDSWLTTMDGQIIDSDTKTDKLPIVQVSASFKMKLKLKVRVYNSHASTAEIVILDFIEQ